MRGILFFAFFTLFFNTAFSQSKYVGFRIDSAVRAEMRSRHIPGLQMVVIKYGVVIKKAHYGMASLEDRVAVTDSSLFSVGSITNAFTSAAILLLMEEGKLDLDDPVSKYVDAGTESLPDSISIRELMMRRGVDSILSFSYELAPFILGRIIEKVSGESYADFMKHEVFEKIGMKNTRINQAEEIIPNRVSGYRFKNGHLIKGAAMPADAAARADIGMLTTATDMQKWYAAIQDSSLLHTGSLKIMFTPGILNDGNKSPYNFGWFLSAYRDRDIFYLKSNEKTGFNSVMEFYPEDGVCIIILGNLHQAAVQQIGKIIVGLFSADYLPASRLMPMPDPDSARTVRLKTYFTEMISNPDSAAKRARELHLLSYPSADSLNKNNDPEEFIFMRSIEPKKPRPNLFGDIVSGIYLYKIKRVDAPAHYVAFFLDPSGKVVYMNYEE